MTAVSVIGPDGNAAGTTVELPEEIFAAKVNVPLIHQVVVAQQAAARQGTHATKTRGDVPRTKDALTVLVAAVGQDDLGRPSRVLVVAHRDDEITWKSLRNVPRVHVLTEDQLNTYDVLASDHVVFTEQALTAFVSRSAKEASK